MPDITRFNDKQVMGFIIVIFSVIGLFLATTGFFD